MKPVRKVVDSDVFDKVCLFCGRRDATIETVSNDVWSKAADAVDNPLKYPVYIKLRRSADDETNQR